MIEGRLKGAAAICLLWMVAVAVTFYLISGSNSGAMILVFLAVSLFPMMIGLTVYFGNVEVLSGFNTMTELERSRYNIDEVSSFMGMFFAVFAYTIFLMAASLVIGLVALFVSIIIMLVYINFSNRFKTDTQQKH